MAVFAFFFLLACTLSSIHAEMRALGTDEFGDAIAEGLWFVDFYAVSQLTY